MENPNWAHETEIFKFQKITELFGEERIKRFDLDEGRIWFLDSSNDLEPIDEELAKELLKYRSVTKKYGPTGHCGNIARDVQKLTSMAVGRFAGEGSNHTGEKMSRFVGYGNHFVSRMKLPDGTEAAVDYALSREIDESLLPKDQQMFDVLVLRGKNDGELLDQLSTLYGGKWRIDRG